MGKDNRKLCRRCNKWHTDTFKTCDSCRAKIKKRKLENVAAGKCAFCGKPLDTEFSRCSVCRRVSDRFARKNIEDGLCACGNVTPYLGGTCTKCLERDYRRQRDRRLRGICINCLNPVSSRSTWFCDEHLDNVNKYRTRMKQNIKAQGKCVQCGTKLGHIGDSDTLCGICLFKVPG